MTGRPFRTSDDQAALEALTEELDLRDRVHVTGYVPAGDLPLLYSAASLLVYPSLHEGFGLVPLEAMACGTPVVATSAGALPEVMGVGGGGVLVPPDDPDALAKAVASLLEQPETRQRLGARARPRIVASYSWPRVAGRTAQVYREVVEERRAAGAPGLLAPAAGI
jgi:glycosyltransferase involved in cell wall biosynthesis